MTTSFIDEDEDANGVECNCLHAASLSTQSTEVTSVSTGLGQFSYSCNQSCSQNSSLNCSIRDEKSDAVDVRVDDSVSCRQDYNSRQSVRQTISAYDNSKPTVSGDQLKSKSDKSESDANRKVTYGIASDDRHHYVCRPIEIRLTPAADDLSYCLDRQHFVVELN